MRFILLLLTLSSAAFAAEQRYISLLTQTGITLMISGFSSDLPDATDRYAKRCDGNPDEVLVQPDKLISATAVELQRTALSAQVLDLERWYESSTGRKVTLLEQRAIAEGELEQFQAIPARTEQVIRIYENTSAGILSSSIAVELEYAGWLTSGCLEKVRNGGDDHKIRAEQVYGKVVKEQGEMLESLFKQDTIRTMEFVFSSLSISELTEYADITFQSRAVYTGLVESLKSAIKKEIGHSSAVP